MSDAVDIPRNLPHIGAFVLETLTVGMYGEPRHTLREYVQNAFDSIRTAQRLKELTGRGKVTVTLGGDAIIVEDNGMGVPAQQAFRTLTSVGASKKDRQRDAGFRGIGRLAGMAYCATLKFVTTFPNEEVLTTVEFDCEKLLKAMDPDSGGDVELARLLASAITFTQVEGGAKSQDHFFRVEMLGLENAPETLTDLDKVKDYLAETVPVEFDSTWLRAQKIEQDYRDFFGAPMETIDVFVTCGDDISQIFKPYGEIYQHAKGETPLTEIQFEHDPAGRYWGWIGHLKESAAVTNWQTRGLRVRVRNIQVDGTQLFEKLFSEVKPSYGRFSSYFVGEIHIDPEVVVPNARRDGFEETPAWLALKKALMKAICEPLAKEAYKSSEAAQTDIKKVVTQVEDLVSRGEQLAANPKTSFDQVVGLLGAARRLRRNASAALKVAASVDEVNAESDRPSGEPSNVAALQEAARNVETIESQARMLIGQFMDDDEKTASLRARIREEVIEETLAIINAYVDPPTYQVIRRRLLALR